MAFWGRQRLNLTETLMPTLSVQSRILAVPKAGAEASEYEDAAAVRDEAWPLRAAVADGATESVFARAWAETLAEGLTERPATPTVVADALPSWQDAWAAPLADRSDEAPWYVSAKAEEGAFATILGLELQEEGHWRAVALGDCVLFHLRDDRLRRAWPYAAPDAFTNRPVLLPSRPDRSAPTPDDYGAVTGTWQVGDAFLLATDAVAAWLLRTDPVRVQTWTVDVFRDAVDAARTEGRLRNDDSTLLVLEMNEPPDEDSP